MILIRILALIRKELQILLADPQSRQLVIAPVIVQALLFPLAATLEVKNNTLAVLNEDGGHISEELVQRLARAEAFTRILHLYSADQIASAMDTQKAIALVRFPQDFSRRVTQGQTVPLQILLDGRRSNSSQIAAGYIQ